MGKYENNRSNSYNANRSSGCSYNANRSRNNESVSRSSKACCESDYRNRASDLCCENEYNNRASDVRCESDYRDRASDPCCKKNTPTARPMTAGRADMRIARSAAARAIPIAPLRTVMSGAAADTRTAAMMTAAGKAVPLCCIFTRCRAAFRSPLTAARHTITGLRPSPPSRSCSKTVGTCTS